MERFNKVFPLPLGRVYGWRQRHRLGLDMETLDFSGTVLDRVVPRILIAHLFGRPDARGTEVRSASVQLWLDAH